MILADLHIHSKYSRATSKDCVPEMLDFWARRKGLDLIGTGDFTHPGWRAELREKLVPAEEGLYTLRGGCRVAADGAWDAARPRMIVTGEISSIYKQDGKVRKVHNLILLPSLEAAETLSARLETVGNLHSDGRPILGLSSRDLCEIVFEACPDAVFIPAHIWTPHFSMFGAYSGFDTMEECFGDMTPHIHALETGLSSDPPMNWRLSALDGYTLVSNSDAHSPSRLAREANVFDTDLSYPALARALNEPQLRQVASTIEFFPEEGKYHYDGHRNCGVRLTPAETIAAGGVCPVCGKRITVGVLHRVEELADRPEGFVPPDAARFESLVPLPEVVAASTGLAAGSVRIERQVRQLLREIGSELFILRLAPLSEIERWAGVCTAEGVRRLREGRVDVLPGFDGEYGKVTILSRDEAGVLAGQTSLFGEQDVSTVKKPCKPILPPRKKKAAPKAAEPEIRQDLNERQWEAVSAQENVVAVVAGPGTGKTRTLVRRALYLVEQRGVAPENICAVTFTNQAAAQLRTQLAERLGPETAGRITVGTFHSVSLGLLPAGENGAAFSLLGEEEAAAIVGELLHEKRRRASARDTLRGISRLKCGLDDDVVPPAARELLEDYNAQLRALGALDFDDILLEALRLCESGAVEISPQSHLLVDEFQDCNDVQYRLARLWGRGSLFVIGDPDQAIYGFRGADPRCFARLREDFPAVREIRLVENYRSTPEILRCALPVVGAGAEQLIPTRATGAAVSLLDARDPFAEALFVVKEIVRMVGGIEMLDAQEAASGGNLRPRGFSDIAVLYRTHRQARVIEECLVTEGVPYLVRGRDDFLAEEPVRHAVAFFRFLLAPGDLASLRALLRLAGFPTAAITGILEQYAGWPQGADALERIAEAASKREAQRLAAVVERLRRFGALAPQTPPRELIEAWAADSALAEEESVRKLINAAVLHREMGAFLQNLTLGTEGDVARSGGRAYMPDAVSLMTLHAAKGLEFPVVFLCGARRGTIPLQSPGFETDANEERRLLYVGMTRAQEELLLLYSGEPSPLLANVPADCLETGSATVGKRSFVGRQLSLF